MHPTLFHLGPITIRSYGVMMMVGFLISIHLAARRARKCGADEEFLLNLGLVALLVGLIGARVFYVAHYLPMFLASPNPLFAMINLTAGGLEFYGGFLAAIAAVIIYTRVTKRSLRLYLDILAPAIMLGLAFGRLGCFLNGCCWGSPTKLPWAIRFPYGSLAFEHQWKKTHELAVPGEFILAMPAGAHVLIDHDTLNTSDEDFQKALAQADPAGAYGRMLGVVNGHLKQYDVTLADLRALAKKLDLKSVPIHPAQIYSFFSVWVLSLFLGWYFWRRRRHGMVLLMMFVVYPIARFILESLRSDNPQDMFGLTVSQAISVAAIPLALLAMLLLRRLPEVSPRAQAEFEARKAGKPAKQKGRQKVSSTAG